MKKLLSICFLTLTLFGADISSIINLIMLEDVQQQIDRPADFVGPVDPIAEGYGKVGNYVVTKDDFNSSFSPGIIFIFLISQTII